MSFNITELFHSLIVKKIVHKVLLAAKPEIDLLLLSVPGAAPFVPEADALLEAVSARLTHLEQNQEEKAAAGAGASSASVTVEVKSSQ